MSKEKIQLHIMEVSSEKMLYRQTVFHCPRVGDEIRLGENQYYKVELIIWCLDETDSPFTRVNVGVTKIGN